MIEAVDPAALLPHQTRMRWAAIFALCVVSGGAIAAFAFPGGRSSVADPFVVSAIALIACLWIGGTANADARNRLERVKRAYAATGDMSRLLRSHFGVYLVILGRLECIVAVGLVSSFWGLGAKLSLPFFALAAAMIGLTWPNADKTRLLVKRAAALRD